MTHVDRIAFAIALAVIPVAVLSAKADQLTTSTTTVTTAGSPAVVVAPLPDASTTVIEYSHSYPASSTSVEVYDKELFPKYSRRLELMLEQINQGESKGLMTSTRATELRTEQGRLVTLSRTVKTNGYQRPELDDLEKQLTSFNADISHAMTATTSSTN